MTLPTAHWLGGIVPNVPFHLRRQMSKLPVSAAFVLTDRIVIHIHFAAGYVARPHQALKLPAIPIEFPVESTPESRKAYWPFRAAGENVVPPPIVLPPEPPLQPAIQTVEIKASEANRIRFMTTPRIAICEQLPASGLFPARCESYASTRPCATNLLEAAGDA